MLKTKAAQITKAKHPFPLPLPYHAADGEAVATVAVILKVDIARIRTQVATIARRNTSIRPPKAIYKTIGRVAVRVVVVARPEKVKFLHRYIKLRELLM